MATKSAHLETALVVGVGNNFAIKDSLRSRASEVGLKMIFADELFKCPGEFLKAKQINELLNISALLISKAGGSQCAEVFATRTPMYMYGLNGGERQNAELMTRSGLGFLHEEESIAVGAQIFLGSGPHLNEEFAPIDWRLQLRETLAQYEQLPVIQDSSKAPLFAAELPAIKVLNLDRSVERWESMTAQLNSLDLKYERFSAVDGRGIVPEFIDKNYSYDALVKDKKMSAGEFGNYLSHYKLLKDFVTSREELLIVFEDDLVLGEGFEQQLRAAIGGVPVGWDIIHLGAFNAYWWGNLPGARRCDASGNYLRLEGQGPAGNFAYVVNRKGAEFMLQHLMPIYGPTDEVARCNIYSGKNGPFNSYVLTSEIVGYDIGNSIINQMGRVH